LRCTWLSIADTSGDTLPAFAEDVVNTRLAMINARENKRIIARFEVLMVISFLRPPPVGFFFPFFFPTFTLG
jgi:hypothetical protein